jgi:hypothetical protein
MRRIKYYKIAPDLAIEAQPLWWLYFQRKGPGYYRNTTEVARILSTTSFSLATAKVDGLNHMSMAFKWNLYKKNDPLRNQALLKEKEDELKQTLQTLDETIDSLLETLLVTYDVDSLTDIKDWIEELNYRKKRITQDKMQELADASNDYVHQHWNTDMLDVAFGKVYTYNNTALDSLRLNNIGWSLWINGAKGLGKRHLFGAMLRINHIGLNNNYLLGASYRYGTEKYNFFTELVYQRLNNHAGNGFSDEEYFAGSFEEDLGTGWYAYNEGEGISLWTLSYGGDFRLSRNILLNFALRVNLNNELRFQSFLPVANVICLMN